MLHFTYVKLHILERGFLLCGFYCSPLGTKGAFFCLLYLILRSASLSGVLKYGWNGSFLQVPPLPCTKANKAIHRFFKI